MTGAVLTAFWIQGQDKRGPLGFGVTARSLDDALNIIRALNYGDYLPEDSAGLQITESVTVADLKDTYVLAHMGPINVRGMWYPFVRVGVPS